jgi:hypothetical protein
MAASIARLKASARPMAGSRFNFGKHIGRNLHGSLAVNVPVRDEKRTGASVEEGACQAGEWLRIAFLSAVHNERAWGELQNIPDCVSVA